MPVEPTLLKKKAPLFQKEKRKIIVHMSKIVLINNCFITIFYLELI